MALSWWEKGLWQICMHHWTVHAKVEFQKCPWDVSLAGVHSTTLDPELRNERFTLISFMGFPAMLGAIQSSQMCIFNKKYSKWTFSNGPQMIGKRFMANLHASLDSTCKSRISKMSMRCQSCRGPFHNFGSWTQKWKIYIDLLWGFLQYGAIQPSQICIFNTKYSKLTFSNGPQLMRKKVYGKFACIIGQYIQK